MVWAASVAAAAAWAVAAWAVVTWAAVVASLGIPRAHRVGMTVAARMGLEAVAGEAEVEVSMHVHVHVHVAATATATAARMPATTRLHVTVVMAVGMASAAAMVARTTGAAAMASIGTAHESPQARCSERIAGNNANDSGSR